MIINLSVCLMIFFIKFIVRVSIICFASNYSFFFLFLARTVYCNNFCYFPSRNCCHLYLFLLIYFLGHLYLFFRYCHLSSLCIHCTSFLSFLFLSSLSLYLSFSLPLSLFFHIFYSLSHTHHFLPQFPSLSTMIGFFFPSHHSQIPELLAMFDKKKKGYITIEDFTVCTARTVK